MSGWDVQHRRLLLLLSKGEMRQTSCHYLQKKPPQKTATTKEIFDQLAHANNSPQSKRGNDVSLYLIACFTGFLPSQTTISVPQDQSWFEKCASVLLRTVLTVQRLMHIFANYALLSDKVIATTTCHLATFETRVSQRPSDTPLNFF